MRDFFKNNWQILLLETIVITIFITFFGRFGDLMVDSFREAYIPQEILNGKVIYKNIFVIYPPLAYLINALLIKIFNSGFQTLYFAGLFSTMSIIFLTYKIGNIFFNKNYSSAICLFVISGLVLSPNVFNSFFPYSYGILYGVMLILSSIYFAINKKYPLSYLCYSLAILCKYEFIFYFPLLIFWSKKENWKLNLLAFLLPLVFTNTILAIQGVTFSDIKTTLEIILSMSQTKTLHWFYSIMGLNFQWEHIPLYFSNIVKFLIPINWNKYQEILVWIFPAIFIGSFLRFKFLKNEEKFFIIATLLISIKVFFALTLQAYGVYFLPFALISLFLIISRKYHKILFILLIIWCLIIGTLNTQGLLNKKNELNNITNYIKINTSASDKIIVYPECLAINVITNRVSDDKFYSLIPLYVETFGEDLIIKRLEIIKPKYIIINNYDTSAYYFKEFGKDYAIKTKKWIEKNYKLTTTIEDKWKFNIYKSN